jgi:hypothetical protein
MTKTIGATSNYPVSGEYLPSGLHEGTGKVYASGDFDPSRMIDASGAIAASKNPDISLGLAGSIMFAISRSPDVSRVFEMSEGYDGTQIGISWVFQMTKTVGATLNYSASDEYLESNLFAVSSLPNVTRTVDISGDFNPSRAISASDAVVASQYPRVSREFGPTEAWRGTAQFEVSSAIIASDVFLESRFFIASNLFTATVYKEVQPEQKRSAGASRTMTSIFAFAGGFMGLLGIGALILFFLRRNNSLTEVGDEMGYETDGQNLGLSDSEVETSDDWQIDDFDQAINAAFEGSASALVTEIGMDADDALFSSACDEIF